MSAPESSMMIPGVTGAGSGTQLVTISIISRDPFEKTITPNPIAITFLYPQSTPTHAKPHRIAWAVQGLQAGERIEIRLDTSFPGYAVNPQPFHLRPWSENLALLFPHADVLPSGAFGWELTEQAPSAISGLATGKEKYELRLKPPTNRPLIRYEIIFFDAQGGEHVLDPDIDVEPDP